MDQTLQIEWGAIDRLYCSPSNPRRNDTAIEPVASSLRRFGWQQPIVAKRSGEVIAGNTRLKAAQSLGMTEVPVIWFDGNDLEAVAYAIADNKTHEFSEWDEKALAELLQELRDEDALDGVGFSTEDIDQLLDEINADITDTKVDDPGPGEPPDKPVTQPGDLWILGEHRLLCGDSTKAEAVARVMGEEKAALVCTDPPYLVDYTGERPNDSGKDWSETYKEVEIKDANEFFRAVFQNALQIIAPHAAVYCWHAHKRHAVISGIWEELGIIDHQQVIWVKPASVFGRVYWHFRHEPCMMGWVQGSKPPHDGKHEYDSVWEIDYGYSRGKDNEHPTMKPVELFARPMRKHTDRGHICFEPFSGSGSQIIAAEELGRRCYAVEIEPAFVDVAVRRWQEATGKNATLEESEQSFDEVASERGHANAEENPS